MKKRKKKYCTEVILRIKKNRLKQIITNLNLINQYNLYTKKEKKNMQKKEKNENVN